jgi:hypothetical protein
MLGRITVFKTLILPHISFIGSILEPPEGWIEDITGRVEKFVLKNNRIAKKNYTYRRNLGV